MFVLTDWLIDDWLGIKFAKDIKKYYDDRLWSSWICFYLDAKHFIHKTNPIDQAKAPKSLVWRKRNEVLIKGCTSKGNKAGYGSKVARCFVAISLGKGICYCKHYEELNGKIFMGLWKTTLLRFSKIVVTLQGMCLFKMVIQVITPKLLKLP